MGDLLSYRERLVRLKEIDGGKARQRDDTGKDDSVNDYKDRKKPLDDMMKTIQDNAAEKMADLDMANMSAEEMNDEVEKITKDKNAKCAIIQKQLDDLKKNFTHS